MLVGVVLPFCLVVSFWVFSQWANHPDCGFSWLVAGFAYSALLVSVFGYVLWFRLLQRCGATGASAYHFLMPPLGVLFGWLLLGERVEPRDLLGILPVALGIYLVTRPANHSKTVRSGDASTRLPCISRTRPH